SLEVRPPFLDHEIAEFAARLPERFKIRGRRQKYLLKRLMRNRLPAEILKRKKIGFDIPAHDWLRRELKPLLLEVVSPSAVARTGLFRAVEIQSLVHDHLEGRMNIGFHLWGLLILLLWMDRWQIQSPFPQMEEPSEPALVETSSPIL
ncbi:MAG: asparagine synthetase B, partial [Acidobacteria bacterium]|nr:asparagine synthetase B [Acidobacteriota bacterium]